MAASKNKETKILKEGDYFTRYLLEDGKMKEIKVSKKEAVRDIKKQLKKDKEFLKIMEKM